MANTLWVADASFVAGVGTGAVVMAIIYLVSGLVFHEPRFPN